METTDSQNSAPEPSGRSLAVSRVLEGGLLRLVVSKPVQEAIGRLVGAGADSLASRMEAGTQRRRNDIAARSKMVAALSDAAIKRAVSDPEFVDRAVARWADDLLNKQERREAIGVRAAEVLADDASPAPAGSPSADFMNAFGAIAENTSAEELQDFLARVLAGELRQPGCISRSTLHAASIIDGDAIQALSNIRSWIVKSEEPFMLANGQFLSGQGAKDLALLDSLSLIRINTGSGISFRENSEILYQYPEGGVIIRKARLPFVSITICHLTRVGKELMDVLPGPIKDERRQIALSFSRDQYFGNSAICKCRDNGGEVDVWDVEEISPEG